MIHSKSSTSRSGAVLPFLAVCLIALMGLLALAIDIGILAMARSQAQNVADIAALAGTRTLDGRDSTNNVAGAIAEAKEAARANTVMGQTITDRQVTVQPGVYRYSPVATRFTANFTSPPSGPNESWGLMQVRIDTIQPALFSKIFGVNSLNVGAVATAVHRPRDVAIVLDFSGSMGFSSQINFDPGTGLRSLNPDDRFPRFGPWSIYSGPGMVMNPNNPGTTPTNFNTWVSPTPMQRVWPFVSFGGEVFGPSNLTIDQPHGPAIVQNFFLTDTVTPALIRSGNFPSFTNIHVANNQPRGIVTPAPSEFWNQNANNFVGDKFPLRRGVVLSGHGPPTIDQYAHTAADVVGIARNNVTTSTRDPNFEQHGYDWDFTTSTIKPASQRFQGFTMGPGYFGKTFYMWPPDPRIPVGQIGDGNYVAGDWRRRFFLPRQNSNQNTQDSAMFFSSNGRWKPQNPGNNANYIVNYDAILAWLRRGPQTLPTNMRSGRIVYFNSMPDSIPIDPTTGVLQNAANPDQRFWKDYIDYVIGAGRWVDSASLYGANQENGNGGLFYNNPPSNRLTGKITPRFALTGQIKPYLAYDDNPIHPRAQFWFGPLSLLAYLTEPGNWLPGTSYEAPCWQLRVGINSALDDIKANHPNDLASIIFFSGTGDYKMARVDMSRQFKTMQASLFYPFSLLDRLNDSSAIIRPFNTLNPTPSNPSGIQSVFEGEIPNAGSATCPEMGFKVAYNQLSNAAATDKTYTGRRGATKMVIFETDGNPNTTSDGTLRPTGPDNTHAYEGISTTTWVSNSLALRTLPKDNARAVVRQIVALDTENPPGFSTLRNPARVHALGFGELFEPITNAPMREAALRFLTAIQIDGKTTPAPSGSWNNDSLDFRLYTDTEPYKIITGDANTRIEKMREALERIMQSGVQVALIQ